MKQVSTFLYWFFFAIITFSSCSKEDIHEIITEPKTIIDATYGNDLAQKADIYLPAGRSQASTRVLVIIHGGGWFQGNKSDMEQFANKFQSQLKNYAIVNMNYRLVTFSPVRYMLPTQTDDIQSVISYMAENASEFGIKPEFVLLGLSAGGHLAMLYSYKFGSRNGVKATVNIVGPGNLNDSYYLNDFVFGLAMSYITHPDNLPSGMSQSEFGSPVTWLKSEAPPTISFYGEADNLIPHSQHTALEQALNKANVYNEHHIYPGGHDVGFKQSDDIVAKTVKFISTHVN